MPTQPLAIAMRSFRRNTHVESAFSNMFFAKTHQNSSWILGPCNFGKSFKAVFFLSCPPCNSIGIEHWHHLEDKLLSQQRCPWIIADEKTQETQKGELTSRSATNSFWCNRRAAATSGCCNETFFSTNPKHSMCMVYIYPTMWLILLV